MRIRLFCEIVDDARDTLGGTVAEVAAVLNSDNGSAFKPHDAVIEHEDGSLEGIDTGALVDIIDSLTSNLNVRMSLEYPEIVAHSRNVGTFSLARIS